MVYINTHYQHGHGGGGQVLIQSLALSEHMHRQVVRGFSMKGTTVQPLNHSITIYQWNSGHSLGGVVQHCTYLYGTNNYPRMSTYPYTLGIRHL